MVSNHRDWKKKYLTLSYCWSLQVESRRAGEADGSPDGGHLVPADYQMGGGQVLRQTTGRGAAADAMFGPRAVALAGQRGCWCGLFEPNVTPG